jgi:hypothetical protein|tara:strand:- start:329 stop:451 length:123 start_codon:yes stop_codon:yes gene_type:complete
LFYSEDEHKMMLEMMKQKPPILNKINGESKALTADFGTSD